VEAILSWFLKKVLEVLLSRLVAFVQERAEEIKRDKERGAVNEANQKAYDEAVDRLDRIKRAGELLNGSNVPH
jgi:hypothetical protein